METILQEMEAFKEALRRRASQIIEEHKEALHASGKGQRARAGRQGRRPAVASNPASNQAASKVADLIEAAGPPMLVGWKEVAQAVGNISTRTLQRWEKTLGLPVGRAGVLPVADPRAIREWKEKHVSWRHSQSSE